MPGEMLALTGPNGAGKSTLIRILATLCRPTCGALRILGVDVTKGPREIRRKIAYVPQRSALVDGLSVRDNIALAAAFHGLSPPRARGRIDELLEIFSLADLCDRPVGELSGGQFRRVSIARAMAGDPELVLMDEPSAGLDSGSRRRFGGFLRTLASSGQVALVIASHDRAEIADHADFVVFLENGAMSRVQCRAQCSHPIDSNGHMGRIIEIEYFERPSANAVAFISKRSPGLRQVGACVLELEVRGGEPINGFIGMAMSLGPIASISSRGSDECPREPSWESTG